MELQFAIILSVVMITVILVPIILVLRVALRSDERTPPDVPPAPESDLPEGDSKRSAPTERQGREDR